MFLHMVLSMLAAALSKICIPQLNEDQYHNNHNDEIVD